MFETKNSLWQPFLNITKGQLSECVTAVSTVKLTRFTESVMRCCGASFRNSAWACFRIITNPFPFLCPRLRFRYTSLRFSFHLQLVSKVSITPLSDWTEEHKNSHFFNDHQRPYSVTESVSYNYRYYYATKTCHVPGSWTKNLDISSRAL